MRILQVMAGRRHGGAEAFFERLVIALARAGVEQRIVIRRDEGRAARLRQAGLSPVEMRFGGPFDIMTRWRLARQLRQFQPDVALTWMSRATSALPVRSAAGDKAVRVGRLGGYYDLKYYRHCDHLIANTSDIVAYIRRSGWPEERVHYLPNFVDPAPAAAADRDAMGVPRDAILALALGRLHPNKAFDTLLAALARAPRIYLWLAGEGEQRATLEALVKRFGLEARVKFLGWRDDVAALMAASDLVVCPSRHEPLGNVILEAWAHRRPVLAAASAGPAGLIANERTGLLVPVDEVEALAAALTRLAEDRGLRDRLAAGGHEAYLAEFTEPAVVTRYQQFFEKIVRECAV